MKKLLRAAAASGVAAATLAGGLAFGPAAVAAPTEPRATTDASTDASRQMILKLGGKFYTPKDNAWSTYVGAYSTLQEAKSAGRHLEAPAAGDPRSTIKLDGQCLGAVTVGSQTPNRAYFQGCQSGPGAAAFQQWVVTPDGQVHSQTANGPVISGVTNISGNAAFTLSTTEAGDWDGRPIAQGTMQFPATAPGQVTAPVDFTFSGDPAGTGRFTAPEHTTIESIENVNDGTVTPGSIASDRRTADIGSDSWHWGAPVKLRVKLRLDQDAPAGTTLGKGSFTVTGRGVTTGSATVTAQVRNTVNGGVAALESTPTTLQRGQAVEVPFAITATDTYEDLDSTIELTAPAGTTFQAGQSVQGQWASEAGNWTPDGPLTLADVHVSDDGKKLTGTLERDHADGFKQWKGYKLRWFAKVIANDDATAGDGTLGYKISGSTNLGAFSVDSTSPVSLDVINGGVAASASDKTTLAQGESVDVPFAVKATGTYDEIDADVTLTAPEGTTFDDDQSVEAQWADEHGDWKAASDLGLTDVEVTNGGTTLTGHVSSPADDFAQYTDWQLRWFAHVTAAETAAPGDGTLRYELTGTTNRGAFAIDSVTATNIPVPEVVVEAPTATGHFPDNVREWAYVEGAAQVGATVVATDAEGNEIGRATATAPDGAYRISVDPDDVGFGAQTLTVTQTVGGETSAGTAVTLDYGHNAPAWTAPVNGGTLPGTGFTLTGSGTEGAEVSISGTDFTNGIDLGTVTVGKDGWSTTNTTLTLPAGPYQLWATQYTKGGKWANTGVNATVEKTKPDAPTVDGYFPTDVRQWAGIAGAAKIGATIVAYDKDGDEIGRDTARGAEDATPGAYNIGIDPSMVGMGVQQFTVVQIVDGVASDPVPVSLDYGYNTPAWTSPLNGSTLPGRDFTLTGTGTEGAQLKVDGNDFTRNTDLGTVTVGKDGWSVTNTTLDLPAGPYQLWAMQYTKGGKWANTGVNVTVAAVKPATPTAQGYFPQDVTAWAGITGKATSGATVIAYDKEDNEIGRATATAPDGAYDIPVDPTKVGMGVQQFTVVQEYRGVTSDAQPVSLDYGQNAPVWTSPTNGGTVAGTGYELTGTGTQGGTVAINGTDFTTGTDLGTATVGASGWTVTSDITLPAGPYQFWATQKTKGGKWANTGVNATVTD